jgi:hypothetical protein
MEVPHWSWWDQDNAPFSRQLAECARSWATECPARHTLESVSTQPVPMSTPTQEKGPFFPCWPDLRLAKTIRGGRADLCSGNRFPGHPCPYPLGKLQAGREAPLCEPSSSHRLRLQASHLPTLYPYPLPPAPLPCTASSLALNVEEGSAKLPLSALESICTEGCFMICQKEGTRDFNTVLVSTLKEAKLSPSGDGRAQVQQLMGGTVAGSQMPV